MLIESKAGQWEITVPAKVNLFLEVLGKRADGYHDLNTVMLAISLCDRLRFRAIEGSELNLRLSPATSDGFRKLSEQDTAWEIPTDHSNLVLRALEAVRRRYGVRSGIDVELIKVIPSQSGLGGGSSDAAGAIVGGMLTWLGEFRAIDAAELASGLGSDINFFIEGRAAGAGKSNWLAQCVGRGEIVRPIRSDWPIDLVVVHPWLGCSTKRIFGRLAESNWKRNDSVAIHEMLLALEQKDRFGLARSLFNRLGAPAAQDNPWIEQMRELLADDPSVMGNCVSGSGSSVFAVLETAEQAERLADRLRNQHPVRAYAIRSWQTPAIDEQLSTLNR